jgi:Uma2 family endonuclease
MSTATFADPALQQLDSSALGDRILEEGEALELLPMETDEVFYELVDGRRVEIPPMSIYATKITNRLTARLNVFVETRQLGEIVSEGLFRLPLPQDLSRNRRPDIAFVSFERWPANRPVDVTVNAWDVVPDLAIEVTSPTDRAEDQREKVLEYFQAGVRCVWVVYPRLGLVDVYDSPTSLRIFASDGSLLGDPVLPGFQLPLAELFIPQARPNA